MNGATVATTPLFPLQTVLFPGGRLNLKVFEARYLDMVGECLRAGTPFGVVCLRSGGEVQPRAADGAGGAPPPVRVEALGVLARIDEVDAEQPGILHLRCTGLQRFTAAAAPVQVPGGLWRAPLQTLPDDAPVPPPDELAATVRALREAIDEMRRQGAEPFIPPYRFDDAGWIANRWCEILPISLGVKQRLMALPDAVQRLARVDEFLRSQGALGD